MIVMTSLKCETLLSLGESLPCVHGLLFMTLVGRIWMIILCSAFLPTQVSVI